MKSIESLVERATDATLTTDNWEYILDVTDAISAQPELGTKQAIKAVAARLSQRDANVILRSLALLVSMGENCGSRMKQEISSKQFLQDNLLKKLDDRKMHRTVKVAVAQTIAQLNESFKLDPSLRPISDAYEKVQRDYRQYLDDSLSAGLVFADGPLKPAKREMTTADKQREDEELQRALKMSLQEFEREQTMSKVTHQQQQQQLLQQWEQQHGGTEQANNQPPEADAASVATVSKVRALYDLISYEQDELSFRKGDVITVIESVYRDWWRGCLPDGSIGIFPLNYVTPIVQKSPQDLKKEEKIEDRILNQEARKVDQLLVLLLDPNADENQVTALYNEIVPLRPQVGLGIEKYGVRKEELTQLHHKLHDEVKQYNELMDQQIAAKREQFTGGYSQPLMGNGQPDQGYQMYQSTGQHANGHSRQLSTGVPNMYKPPANAADSGPRHLYQSFESSQHPQQQQQQQPQLPQQTQPYLPIADPQQPPLFQNYKPTGHNQAYPSYPQNPQGTSSQYPNETGPPPTLFQNYKPTGTTNHQYPAYDYEPSMPATLFNTGHSQHSTHSNASQYSQPYYTQLKELLQQQPTSSGFGNSNN